MFQWKIMRCLGVLPQTCQRAVAAVAHVTRLQRSGREASTKVRKGRIRVGEEPLWWRLHRANPELLVAVVIPRIAKQMAIFQYRIIIFQGKFSIISAFSIENVETRWHLYCNSLLRVLPIVGRPLTNLYIRVDVSSPKNQATLVLCQL